MIKPEEFYSPSESPDSLARQRMWRVIAGQMEKPRAFVLYDRRSFVLGVAASIVLMFAVYGVWSLARNLFENAQPEPLKVERAYVSAIREFQQVIPVDQGADTSQASGRLQDRRAQLALLNEAIAALRNETNGRDLSPLKRARLRALYSKQLSILQHMMDEGVIEL